LIDDRTEQPQAASTGHGQPGFVKEALPQNPEQSLVFTDGTDEDLTLADRDPQWPYDDLDSEVVSDTDEPESMRDPPKSASTSSEGCYPSVIFSTSASGSRQGLFDHTATGTEDDRAPFPHCPSGRVNAPRAPQETGRSFSAPDPFSIWLREDCELCSRADTIINTLQEEVAASRDDTTDALSERSALRDLVLRQEKQLGDAATELSDKEHRLAELELDLTTEKLRSERMQDQARALRSEMQRLQKELQTAQQSATLLSLPNNAAHLHMSDA
jgi:chaperonin cofactor prefoldin